MGRLLVERKVGAVAVDSLPEIPFWLMPHDPGLPPGPNRRHLLGNGTIIIQKLANVGAIGEDGFALAAVPLPLHGLDGSPARVFAMID